MLTKFTADIIFGLLMFGIVENFLGIAGFNDMAHMKEGRIIGNPFGLLHGMRDNNDGEFLF